MRRLLVLGVCLAFSLAGCITATTESASGLGRLTPHHGWPNAPSFCTERNATYPYMLDDVQPRLDLSFTTRPERLEIRDLPDPERLTVRQTIADTLPTLDGRNGTLTTLMQPVMDGVYPYRHIGDWHFTIHVHHDDGPDDRHDLYLDKADDRPHTRTLGPEEGTVETWDPPNQFELEYGEAVLYVDNTTAAGAHHLIRDWNNETDTFPHDYEQRSARWSPHGTDCVLATYQRPFEEGALSQPWCATTRTLWVDVHEARVEPLPMPRGLEEYC